MDHNLWVHLQNKNWEKTVHPKSNDSNYMINQNGPKLSSK